MAKTILIVDDDRMSLELSKRNLAERGYEIVTASNGQEALDKMAQKLPDLILLDVEMPVMNGYTFVIERAKNPVFQPVPVVMLTSHNETAPLFKRHSVRGYLIKPLDTQKLFEKVTELIGPAA